MATLFMKKVVTDTIEGAQWESVRHGCEAVALPDKGDAAMAIDASQSLYLTFDHPDIAPDDAGRMAVLTSNLEEFPDFDPEVVANSLQGQARHAAIHLEVARFASEHGQQMLAELDPDSMSESPWQLCADSNGGTGVVYCDTGYPAGFEPYNP